MIHFEATPIALTCDEVLRIARQDAVKAYRDTSRFCITLELQADGWHVAFHIAKPMTAGGGPHYVIDAITGAILNKTYYQ